MRLLYGHDKDVADWVAAHIPHMAAARAEEKYGEAFGPASAIGVLDDRGAIRAGVVYHAYLPHYRSIELSCASDCKIWARPDIVRALLGYPFTQLQLGRLTCLTPRHRAEPRKFLEHLGFKREGVVRWGFGDDHAMVYGLLAKEWARHPYSQSRAARTGAATHGQKYSEAAARA